ncbi:MAG: HIT domain-containing protein [Desulfovibrionaceae bacterium]|nr:HIT domain-containing protein [Desulfovibrionaceae bacterium]
MSQPLWAPWRMEYILGEKPDSCVLCLPQHDTSHDEERLVLHRGTHAFVMMNRFPYNNGHLMVAPFRHVSDLTLLSQDEMHEISDLLQMCADVIKEFSNPQGINVGLNLGEAAGAGIRDHLHFHLVPRWNGDTSFMAVMSETRVIPDHIRSTYSKLQPLFARRTNTD